MLAHLAQAASFEAPAMDYHALAPQIVLIATIVVLVLLDSIRLERARAAMPAIASLGFLAALVPVVTLAARGGTTSMFGGSFVVGPMALVLTALFLVAGYVVVLLSMNYIAEGDYWESEYYTLLVCSVLGMTVMAASRDLIGIFVALELISIPSYMLAAWRKGDERSNEAGMKYYLMGVFASAVLLYGLSLAYGVGGSTQLTELARGLESLGSDGVPVVTLALLFTVIGFAFKVSAVPFHVWAPDTYEGAPTPVTAFLAVASKAAGFVALIQVVWFCFAAVRPDVVEPLFWVLSVASMTVGNLIALRQTNVVRMLAYSGIAQAGFMLAPFAVISSDPRRALQSLVVYLVIYAAMNLGAFACVIAIARTTRSMELKDLGGLFGYMPALTVMFTMFLASLVGIPPLGGWFAKFGIFAVLAGADTGLGWSLAVIMAVNTAIAAYYYLNVARAMWFDDAPEGARRPGPTPASLGVALVLTLVATIVFGVLPSVVGNLADFHYVALPR